jgi:hypothetical protein
LRNVLNFRSAPLTSTRPSIPPFLQRTLPFNNTLQILKIRMLTLIQLKCS